MAGLRRARWLLSVLIFVSAIVLIGMGIVIIIFSLAAVLEFNKLALHNAADLLKVDNDLTSRNLREVFNVLCTVGYGTVNIATLAVCAASGRRRAHSAVAAAGSGLAAFLYLSLMLSFIRPRIGTVSKLLDDALEKYYKAFQLTGDEKFLSQIQLQSGCCGLDKGPEDFEAWKRPVPSSCCGSFTGNCSLAKSRRTPCRTAVKSLSGSDGLFDCGYISWLLGVGCGVMGGLLALLTLGGGSSGFETLLSIETEDTEESGGDESKIKKKSKRRSVADGGALQPKGSVALPAGVTGATGREPRFQVQDLLRVDIRQRGGGAERQKDNVNEFLQRRLSVGGMRGQLQEKLIRELEKERQRLAVVQAGPSGRGGGGGVVGPRQAGAKALEEKLQREADIESRRAKAIAQAGSSGRGGGGGVVGPRQTGAKALEEKLQREADIESRRAKAIAKKANRRPSS